MDIYGQPIDIICHPSVFGDGMHETTRFLLYFLNRYANGKTVIDAGCGSGILSVFSAKVGASVTAIDNDSIATECTQSNAINNSVYISIINDSIMEANIKADIVTANFCRTDALALFPYFSKMADELIITTWYKELPTDKLTEGYEIVDYIEGIDYDCYVIKKKGQANDFNKETLLQNRTENLFVKHECGN